MSAPDYLGRFVWYDLMTTDPASAESFYKKVVGWGTAPWEGGETPYTMWMNGETAVGGIMQLPEEAAGAPPHWLAYIATPDVDATCAQATELGGTLIKEPMDIPEVGRFAVLADPQGAVFAAYSPASAPPGNEGPAQVGEFSWHELATTDHEAAFEFYHALFGWDKTDSMDMGDMGTYQMYGREGMTLGGMFNKPAEMSGPPAWLYYARVDDVHSAAEEVQQHGGTVLNGPMEVPGGDHIVQCLDPQGTAFALHSGKSGS
jgi:predicted enzyme related to lactoylglutathione lyase